MNRELNVLMIEDDDNDYHLILRALAKQGLHVNARRVDQYEAIAEAMSEAWDVVISDNNIPDARVSISNTLEISKRVNPNTPFIIVSGTLGEENAVRLMKLGANDYILKENLTRLAPAIERELLEAASRDQKHTAEKMLRDSQERYRILAASIQDMFFALSPDLRCTFWNMAAEKTTGISAEDAVGKPILEVLPIIKREDIWKSFNQSMLTLVPHTIEVEIKVEDQRHYYQVSIYPSPEMHSVIVKDITDSRSVVKKLAHVNEELETFIYRVSHDIRGPLASMKGLLNLAQTGSAVSSAEFYQRMDAMTNRLETVIHNFQEIVRIKQRTPEYQRVPLADMVERIAETIPCPRTDYDIVWEMDSVRAQVVIDPGLIGIALEKIMANALDFQSPERRARISIRCTYDENQTRIRITDNGVGMPQEHYDKIFKMFFRGNLQSVGSGLGLYMAATAVEKLSGTIEVESTEGVGTSFTIKVPYPDRITLKG